MIDDDDPLDVPPSKEVLREWYHRFSQKGWPNSPIPGWSHPRSWFCLDWVEEEDERLAPGVKRILGQLYGQKRRP